jgi:hypothetical protein
MAEATQYQITNKELVELIIRRQGIHDGIWMLAINFGFAPGNFGPTETQMNPGIAVVVQQFSILRVALDQPPPPPSITVDASIVNPPTAKEVQRKSEQKRAAVKKKALA